MSGVRVAVVTGGASGIGRSIAEALASDGFALAVLDKSLPAGRTTIDDLIASGARAANGYRFDLAETATHRPTMEAVENDLGAVDVLINNAGIPARARGDLLEMTPENFDAVMDVNLRGTFFLTQEVARRMAGREAPRRSIITVSSVSAAMASIERGEYCLSKSALPMLARLFALRLAGAGIGVFEVRPGIIRTPMTEKVSTRYDELIASGLVPAGRWGEGSDVAEAVRMLAAGRLGFSTGSVVSVDGGLSIDSL